jgi:hypothetical protein
MFGLSFPKLLVLVAVISIVWFGFRWFQRWEKERRDAERQAARVGARAGGPAPGPTAATAEDLAACRVCGTYVASDSARACGRSGCPFPPR